MASLGVALPLQLDSSDGFRMLKSFKALVKQNLKMIILTNPGERVMEPSFGVGLNQFLFENFGHDTKGRIESKIREQVSIYMPAVQIRNITFASSLPDSSYLGMHIEYAVPGIGIKDLLELTT